MSKIGMHAAIDWLIQQRDPGFSAWDEFTDWLEEDPRNADAYAELSVRDELIGERLIDAPSREPEQPQPRRLLSRRSVMGGGLAVAASLALAFGAFQLQTQPSPYGISTAPGVQETVTLAGGTVVTLNGATSLRLDRNNPRFAKLESGEARFMVVHDDDDPFRVQVGGAELIDLGTVFNVVRDRSTTEVAVAEGVVMFKGAGQTIRLDPGRTLRASDENGSIVLGSASVTSIGSWQQGRLVYEGAPLAVVARDLSRNLGVPVTAENAIATRPVTAVVQMPADRRKLAERLERLLDIEVRQTNEGWILTAGG